jgi:hypothetical protein
LPWHASSALPDRCSLVTQRLADDANAEAAGNTGNTYLLDALHEEVGDPQRVEQVARAVLLRAGVLAQVEELKHVRVPRLEVDRKRA